MTVNDQSRNELILVIDDDSAVRDSLAIALEDFEYDVLKAEDGKKGLDIYIENYKRIDLVVLDMVMPRMSGKKVLEKMLGIDPSVKVIVTSGHSEEQLDENISRNIKHYLVKPFEIETLDIVIRSVLDA